MKRRLAALAAALLMLIPLAGCNVWDRAKANWNDRFGTETPTEKPTRTPRATATPAETATPAITVAPTHAPSPTLTPTAKPTLGIVTASPKPSSARPAVTPAGTRLSGNRPDLTDDEMYAFFTEVVFGGETSDWKVEKWVAPITVSVSGSYKEDDGVQVAYIFHELNQVKGFPGSTVLSGSKGSGAAFQVKFVTQAELQQEQPKWSGKSSCYATFHTNKNYEIENATLYIVSEWEPDQAARNYLITWGIFYGLGMTNDSGMYYDSIFNPDYYDTELGSSFQDPVMADYSVATMLYYQKVKSGMTLTEAIDAFK